MVVDGTAAARLGRADVAGEVGGGQLDVFGGQLERGVWPAPAEQSGRFSPS